jgi:hypothetical protein
MSESGLRLLTRGMDLRPRKGRGRGHRRVLIERRRLVLRMGGNGGIIGNVVGVLRSMRIEGEFSEQRLTEFSCCATGVGSL